jgi:predicted HicB family RNase H-like nuclease
MSKPQSTYSLRLPTSVKAEVVRRAKADGTSFNQFVHTQRVAAHRVGGEPVRVRR